MPVHVIWYYPVSADAATSDSVEGPEKDYARMNAAIGRICIDGLMFQPGVWLVRTPRGRDECLEQLSEFTEIDDTLVVCESSGVSYRSRNPTLADWMDERITPGDLGES